MTTAREHTLKCWPSFFEALANGTKTFEVRYNDRDFSVGDTLRLEWWDPHTRSYGDRQNGWRQRTITARVSFVLHGINSGIAIGWCAMGLADVKELKQP